MASARDLTALPEYHESKAITQETVPVDTASGSVSKKRQSLSDLFTIVSIMVPHSHSHSRRI